MKYTDEQRARVIKNTEAWMDGRLSRKGNNLSESSCVSLLSLADPDFYRIAPRKVDFETAVRECEDDGRKFRTRYDSHSAWLSMSRKPMRHKLGYIVHVRNDELDLDNIGLKSWMLTAEWEEVTDEDA